ncbi:hypothetical protein [Zhihengliuella sp.]|uniref:hypothetical protein n=1 Tax=Zhihengliuella sp. TaxID=1954483 RepID=UPI002811BB61|nr:hypothetical protein [Zhihengliuella sp.]
MNTPDSPHPVSPAPGAPTQRPRAAAPLMRAAVAVAAVSLICLAVILVGYAAGADVWPGFFAVGLYGLPAAFALLVASLLVSWSRRRRQHD